MLNDHPTEKKGVYLVYLACFLKKLSRVYILDRDMGPECTVLAPDHWLSFYFTILKVSSMDR